MENNINIQNMQEEHVEDVYNIEQELISVPWSKQQIADLLKQSNATCRVLLDGDKVIGYYSFYNICGEANINNLAVSKEYQGKGLGNMIMKDLIDKCYELGILDITLEVSEKNKVAYALYTKFGFAIEGVRKAYYNNKYNALIMWRRN